MAGRGYAGLRERLGGQLRHMQIYTRPGAVDQVAGEALRAIPVAELEVRAAGRCRAEGRAALSPRDALLRELLRWFKTEFFTWVDSLPCEACAGKTQATGGLQPGPSDMRYGAGRVEAHRCQRCGHVTRFPRYNDPVKLLETRRGRCGEWANCFFLCCHALQFRARYVLDFTDHVWVEVWSDRLGRWLHCDSCENACDQPLMYEQGWGKKLGYIFAFGFDSVADVIWRYSQQRDQTLARRTTVSEGQLAELLGDLNVRHARPGSIDALVRELVAFTLASPTIPSPEELQGRQSGSLAWRRARGELGQPQQQPQQAASGPAPAASAVNPFAALLGGQSTPPP